MKKHKYDLKKLTKEQILEIIKVIDSDFTEVENFKMKNVPEENDGKIDKDIIEMIDPDAKKGENDVYGRYHIKKHYVSLSAWDEGCYWHTPVHLYEDHFDVLDYHGLMDRVTPKLVKKYVAMLDKFLGQKQDEETLAL